MTAIHEFAAPLPVETPLGPGQAIVLIDYGTERNTCWLVALDNDGQMKHFESNDIKLSLNHTYHYGKHKSEVERRHPPRNP